MRKRSENVKKFAADNLMFLRRHYPQIYAYIRNRTPDPSRIEIALSKNGQPNLLVINQETGGRMAFYSQYNPEREVGEWLDSLGETVRQAEHVLFCGLGLGYHLQAFIDAFPEKKIYLYEPEEEYLLSAIETVDLTKLLDRKQIAVFAVGQDSFVQKQILDTAFRVIKDSFASIILPAYRKLHPQAIEKLETTIQSHALNVIASLNTITIFQKQWAINIIHNIEKNLRTYSFVQMRNACQGMPAVVVGSGPSLEMEINQLKQLKGHAVIIAAGSSIQALLRHNLEPDLAVSMDPSMANYDVYRDIDLESIPFLYFPTIQHKIIERVTPYMMHAFLNSDSITKHLMDLTKEDPIFDSTSTVTGQAIQAALYLGCNQVVFIGQDFSYPNDQFYATGVTHVEKDKLDRAVQNADQYVPNVNGGMNRTSRSMLALKISVETLLDKYNFDRYYNASTVGAVIEGTKPKTLKQLYEECQDNPRPAEWFKTLVTERCAFYPDEKKNRVMDNIRSSKLSVEEIMQKTDEIEDHFRELASMQNANQAKINRWFADFDRIWSGLVDFEPFKHLYLFLVQREFNYVQRFWPDLKARPDSFDKILDLGRTIAPLIAAIKRVTPYLQESFEQLIHNLENKKEASA
jgi:hypothetical protein